MKRESFQAFKLGGDEKNRLCEELAAFYPDERDEEIGIPGQQILDFFMSNLTPAIYNKALDDAKDWRRQQMDNMEADYHILYKEV